MTDAYRDCLDSLYGRLNYERIGMPRSGPDLRLGRVRRLLRRLGDPQDALRIVHITGTKGKGSTAAMLAAVLAASGVRTGLFCSPHLHRLEERFQIDGQEIRPDELVALVDAVKDAVEAQDALEIAAGNRALTFFEVTTAMGLMHFHRRNVGAVVLEVGMGGRLDSTNSVRPLLSIITSISFDHTRQLGRTLGAIAFEKAGIIKQRTPVLSGVVEDESREVIRAVATQRRGRLRELGPDYQYTYQPPSQPVTRPDAGEVVVKTWRREWGPIRLPLLGPHQAHNAALVMAALDVLAERGLPVEPEAVERGFAAMRFPARVEVLGESPWIVVDSAHNVASAEALAATLRGCLPDVPRTLIFGTTRDKDLRGQLRALLPMFDHCIATRYLENPRAVSPEEVAEAIRSLSTCPVEIAAGPAEGLALARRHTPSGGLIAATGSIFLAAETRACLLGLNPTPAPTALATP